MTEHYPCEVTEIDECFLKKISWLITFLVYIPLGQAKIPWGIHQERFWLSVERNNNKTFLIVKKTKNDLSALNPSLLSQNCSAAQGTHCTHHIQQQRQEATTMLRAIFHRADPKGKPIFHVQLHYWRGQDRYNLKLMGSFLAQLKNQICQLQKF